MLKKTLRTNSSKYTLFKFFSHLLRRKLLKGPNIKKFESNLKDYVGANHAIAVSSARYGLYLILNSLDLKKGKDEIIMPSYMPAIVAIIAKICGLKIVFADVEPDTLNIDPNKIEEKINENTKILLIVHLYGMPCNMDKILKIVKKHGLFLIEDAAQAFGATYKDKKIGSFGNASVVSFGLYKNINTLGGGVVLTNDSLLSKKIKHRLKNIPLPKRRRLLINAISSINKRIFSNPYFFTLFIYPCLIFKTKFKSNDICNTTKFRSGVKKHFFKERDLDEKELKKQFGLKFTNFQATLGLEQLKNYDAFIKKQNKNAFFIKKHAVEPSIPGYVYPSYFLCVIKVNNCRKTLTNLFKAGISAQTGHYKVLSNSNSDNITNKLIYLPFREHISKRDLLKISNVLHRKIKN